MLLDNKVVIVSGIGPGLGQELAFEAARQGARLAIAARTASRLAACAAEIEAMEPGTEVLQCPTDISDKTQCERLVAATIERFGRLDSLINSAYVPGEMGPLEIATTEDWRAAMEVNFYGTMKLTFAAVEQMKRDGGTVVMINAMASRRPRATQAGYAASKAALLAATQHMALEFGKFGIRVNSAFMGWMWGPPVEAYLAAMARQNGHSIEHLKAEVAEGIPIGRIPDDSECAKPAIFLASDYSTVMNGACVDVNGGEFLPH